LTDLVGVIGHPISHSLSPKIWNAVFTELGVDATFEAFDVEADQVVDFVNGMRGRARGFNVTIPHKEAALALATSASDEATAIGAANVLVLEPDGTRAHNTDVVGVREALRELGVGDNGSVLVLGAGGAAMAAAHAVRPSASEIVVTNRTRARAEALAAAVGGRTVSWDERDTAARAADLVIQATSIGMRNGDSPLTEQGLGGRTRYLLDLVYGPDETPLVHAARRAGITSADGLSMLVHQAARAWHLFFGGEPPVAELRRAAGDAAGRPA
jgi:shikimate dehydrogenase